MNTAIFDALGKRIDAAGTPEELATVQADISAAMEALKGQIDGKIAELAPLMEPPSSPVAAVTWIKNYIEVLAKPYQTYVEQAATVAAQSSALSAKITARAGQLGGA